MSTKKKQNSAESGTKAEQHVGLGIENLFTESELKAMADGDIFELSPRADDFIWNHEGGINDETLRFVRNAFRGFRDEVQDMMADCLNHYFEEVGPEGERYLPEIGIEHIDLLMQQMVYKIDHGYNRY